MRAADSSVSRLLAGVHLFPVANVMNLPSFTLLLSATAHPRVSGTFGAVGTAALHLIHNSTPVIAVC